MSASKYNPEAHRRRSIRLKNYDYSRSGAYFVTVCAFNKECLFGNIMDGKMRLNEYGLIIAREWTRTPEIRKEIELDEFCVIPNHIHGIVTIQAAVVHAVGANGGSPETVTNGGSPETVTNGSSPETGWDDKTTAGRSAESPLRMKTKSISSFIAGFKSVVTKSINEISNTPGSSVWQRNYYEHIIRNDNELNRIREYIANNPAKWAEDEENPGSVVDSVSRRGDPVGRPVLS